MRALQLQPGLLRQQQHVADPGGALAAVRQKSGRLPRPTNFLGFSAPGPLPAARGCTSVVRYKSGSSGEAGQGSPRPKAELQHMAELRSSVLSSLCAAGLAEAEAEAIIMDSEQHASCEVRLNCHC